MTTHDADKLRHEIEELEKQIAANPFGGLFDPKREAQLQKQLRKKKKELARLTGDAPAVKQEPFRKVEEAPTPAKPVVKAAKVKPAKKSPAKKTPDKKTPAKAASVKKAKKAKSTKKAKRSPVKKTTAAKKPKTTKKAKKTTKKKK